MEICDLFEYGTCTFSFNLLALVTMKNSNTLISILIQLVLIESLYYAKHYSRLCDSHKAELAFSLTSVAQWVRCCPAN